MENLNTVALMGPLGPAQLACLHSWKKRGVRRAFIHVEDRPVPAWGRRIADQYTYIAPDQAFKPASWPVLVDFLKKTRSEAIVCLSEDVALQLWQNRHLLPDGTKILANTPDVFGLLESKSCQVDMARGVGLPVLPTWLLARDTVASTLNLPFPIVLRPDRAKQVKPVFKAELINNHRELQEFLDKLAPTSGPVVAQPFIKGPNVVLHGYRALDGSSGHPAAFLCEVKYQGVSVTLRPYQIPSEMLSLCRKFEAQVGLNGVFHYDFILDPVKNELFFLEVNGRLGGTTGKVSASGYDEPAALLRAFGVAGVSDHSLVASRLRPVNNRLASLRCLLTSLKGQGSLLDYPYPDKRAVLRLLLPAMLVWRDEVVRPAAAYDTLVYLAHGLS